MEAMVRRMIEERLGVAPIDGITENSISEPQNVENDILSMLDDLSLFDMNNCTLGFLPLYFLLPNLSCPRYLSYWAGRTS